MHLAKVVVEGTFKPHLSDNVSDRQSRVLEDLPSVDELQKPEIFSG